VSVEILPVAVGAVVAVENFQTGAADVSETKASDPWTTSEGRAAPMFEFELNEPAARQVGVTGKTKLSVRTAIGTSLMPGEASAMSPR
jgi:hypothetical protein